MINKDGYYQTNTSPFTMTRHKFQYARVILLTSLFWVLVDAFLIFYLTDCGAPQIIQQPCDHNVKHQFLGLTDNDNNPRNQNEHADDYDEQMKRKNERLHKIHKMKEREKQAKSERKDDRTNFLSKIKEWFKEDHSAEPTNPPSWPGENGRAVNIPDHLKDESQKRFKENQFNIVASDLVALNRSVPDQRSEACKNREYPVDLPTTSIIIVYHNEGNSTLLRGLMSIVRKSPLKYLKEIILVDDASEGREYLHKPLDEFVKTLPVPVKIFRNEERLGLMRSRLRGADAATGDTMTFLDAHIEATNGWLPPLLAEIKKNRY